MLGSYRSIARVMILLPPSVCSNVPSTTSAVLFSVLFSGGITLVVTNSTSVNPILNNNLRRALATRCFFLLYSGVGCVASSAAFLASFALN